MLGLLGSELRKRGAEHLIKERREREAGRKPSCASSVGGSNFALFVLKEALQGADISLHNREYTHQVREIQPSTGFLPCRTVRYLPVTWTTEKKKASGGILDNLLQE
ncbi:MAG TPA: hypothetical protein VL126_17000 [Bacteroidota bacterium]|nr:hypothetical protein [Bacteroidota bacterium]